MGSWWVHVLGVVRFFGARYAGMLGHKLVGFVLVLAVWQSGEGLQWVDWPRGLKALGFLSLGSMASWVGCAIGESMGTC